MEKFEDRLKQILLQYLRQENVVASVSLSVLTLRLKYKTITYTYRERKELY